MDFVKGGTGMSLPELSRAVEDFMDVTHAQSGPS